MELQEAKIQRRIKLRRLSIVLIIVGMLIAFLAKGIIIPKRRERLIGAELQRAKTYTVFRDEDANINNCSNVKFLAYFLRDVNEDGNLDKISGTSIETGKDDTLYFDLKVEGGKLKNGKITIDANNFYLQMASVKDSIIANDLIGNHITQIELNNIETETEVEKSITGRVRSGDYSYSYTRLEAIGDNINNYSNLENKIILTGTFEDEAGVETEIEKEITLSMDWYGITLAAYGEMDNIHNDLASRVNANAGTVDFDIEIVTEESEKELLISKNHVEGTIPQLNGYDPILVVCNNSGTEFQYDKDTRNFVIERKATVDENGNITNKVAYQNTYDLTIRYSSAAVDANGGKSVKLPIPVSQNYEGYNNTNNEFVNPYISSNTRTTINAVFDYEHDDSIKVKSYVGRYIRNPYNAYIVSKAKLDNLYNGDSVEEIEDYFDEEWIVYTGKNSNGEKIKVNQVSTDITGEGTTINDVVSNVGIYFGSEEDILSEEGEIKVYNAVDEILLLTINQGNIMQYVEDNPFEFGENLNKVRLEISGAKADTYLNVHLIKELNDEEIHRRVTKQVFDSLDKIKSKINVQVGTGEIEAVESEALYVSSSSVAKLETDKDSLNVDEINKVKFKIIVDSNKLNNEEAWENGYFLIKLPSEVVDYKINAVTVDNPAVEIATKGIQEIDGEKFIRVAISTLGEEATNFIVTIDADISINPETTVKSVNYELLYKNTNSGAYVNGISDYYDINANGDSDELIGKDAVKVDIISNNQLSISQSISNSNGSDEAIAPAIFYAPKTANTTRAKLNIKVKNRFSGNAENVVIQGKIPYTGNKGIVSGNSLNSEFNTVMVGAIANTSENVNIYYTEVENPTDELANLDNGWKTAESVTNWNGIKSYMMIVASPMETGSTLNFSYEIDIPGGAEIGKKSYSYIMANFNLVADGGIFKTKTEAKLAGIEINEALTLNIEKYDVGKVNGLKGACFDIKELDGEGNEINEYLCTTDENGKISEKILKGGNHYNVVELNAPEGYNSKVFLISFDVESDETQGIKITNVTGADDENMSVTAEGITLKIENESTIQARIIREDENGNPVVGAKLRIVGGRFGDEGKVLTSDSNGVAEISGIITGKTYTIIDEKAEGYDAFETFNFTVYEDNDEYIINISNNDDVSGEIITSNESSIAKINVINNKQDLSSLTINVVSSTTNETLAGSKFNLYKNGELVGTYIADENGKIEITGLYTNSIYDTDLTTYKLKEIRAKDGYSVVKDIEFKIMNIFSTIVLNIDSDENEFIEQISNLEITIKNSPYFKLIKKDYEGNRLEGIKFVIYSIDEGTKFARDSKGEIVGTKERVNGNEYYLVATDSNGEISLDLPQGKYKAVEVVADQKYDISKGTYYFSIGDSTEGIDTLGVKDYYVIKSSANEYANNIEATRDGGYIVAGRYSNGDLKIGASTYDNKGDRDAFIIKYDESDNVIWSNVISGTGIEEIEGVEELSDNSIIVVGNYSGETSLTIGANTLSNSDGKKNIFIIKYDEDGNLVFAKEINGTEDITVNKITLSANNTVVVSGSSKETFTVDGISIGNAGGLDGFYLEIDNNGTAIAGKNFGGSADDDVEETIKTSDGGYIFVGSYRSSNISIDGNTLSNNGSDDGIIAKVDSTGNYTWHKEISTPNEERINSIVSDSNGNYYVSMVVDGIESSILIGDEEIELNGSTDAILMMYSNSGELLNISKIAGNSSDEIERLKIDNQNRLFAIGNTYSSILTIDGIIELNNTNSMYKDGFVICYGANLSNPHGIEIGGEGSDDIVDVAVKTNNEIIAAGYLEDGGTINDDKVTTDGVDSYVVNLERKAVATINPEKVIPVGTEEDEEVYTTCKTSDGGFLTVGGYTGETIKLGSIVLNRNSNGYNYQVYVAKYNQDGIVIKAANIDNPNILSAETIVETKDGGFILGSDEIIAKFDKNLNEVWSKSVEYEVLQVFSDDEGSYLGAKYKAHEDLSVTITLKKVSSSGETEWQKEYQNVSNVRAIQTSQNEFYVVASSTLYKYDISEELLLTKELGNRVLIQNLSESEDGGIILVGELEGDVTYSNYNLMNYGYIDGIVIKFDNLDSIDWALNCGEFNEDAFSGVTELVDGTYVVVGRTNNEEYTAGGDYIETNGGEDGIILKLSNVYGAENVSELTISNILKKFNITTKVKEQDDGKKGGSISGEKSKVYEVVSYGNNSTKEIVITPDTGYELIEITVNGEEFPFEIQSGETSYRMPLFTGVDENKEIVASFSLENKKITINKVDARDGTKLPNAELRLDQLEERESPVNAVGNIVENSKQYVIPDKTSEIEDVVGELVPDGEYFFTEYTGADGYVPTNGLWYLRAAINKYTSRGIQDSEAKSYAEIDLTSLDGDYAVVLEARSSSHRWDFGYATITDNEDTVSIEDTEGQFMNVSGLIDRADYISPLLEGGHKYYLHLGYLKDEAMDGNEDQVVINSIKVYEAIGVNYGFTQNIDGDYESTNVGKDKTTANGYAKIDLSDYSGKYNLFVKARISSEYNDYGYAVVTETTDRVDYDDETYTKFIDISGEDTEDNEYVTVIDGGKIYYVHFGYCKNSMVSTGEDKFVIKDIYLTPNSSDLYHVDLRTNSNGQAIAQVPYGKYSITETLAPSGYFLNTNGLVVEFREDNPDNHEFTITDEKKAKVIVHHYLNGTNTKVAEDDIVEGKIGLDYTTSPNLDLPTYELIKNNDNEYVLPSNNTGTFTLEDQEVTYYYSDKKIPLIVHHYIEGTTQGVPLADGTTAKDQISYGDRDDAYTTNYIEDRLLDDMYELSKEPTNKNGVLSGTEVEVTYFYRIARRTIEIEVLYQDDNTPIEGASFEINGNTYTSNENGLISVTLPIGEYPIVQTATGYKYDIKENIDDIVITKSSEGDKITIYNTAAKGTVTVHYYELDKDTGVPLKNGELAQDVVKTGKIGDIYITSPLEEVSDDYTLYELPENVNGLYTRENIDVYYYYISSNCSYTVNYLDYTSGEPIKEAKVETGVVYKSVINTPDEIITIPGYNYYRADKDLIEVGIVPEENVINLYYVIMGDLQYTVNYLEVTTNKVLHEKKTYENISFGLEYAADDEVIEIPGYNYTSSNVEVLTIGADSNNNVINLYYSKRTDLKYTVNFLDVADGSSIHTPKVYTNISFETVIECAQEAIIIEGFNYNSVDKDSLTIGVKESDNVINVYYEKRHDLKYTVNYYEKDTTTKVRESKVYENIEYGTKIVSTREILDLHGLDFYSVSADIIVGVDEEQNVINIYYIRQNGISYTVHYVEKDTNRKLLEDKLVENQLYGIEILPQDEYVEVDGYEYDSGDKEKLVLDTDSENEITVFYRKRSDLSYRIKYLEQDTDKILLEEKVVENQVYGSIVVAIEEARNVSIEGYDYSYADKQEITIVTDETRNVITLYFKKLANLTYVVNYLDIDEPTKLLHSSKVVNNQTYLTEILPDDEIIQITGYNYTSCDKERLIISANNSENVLNLYYTRKNDLGYTVYYRNIETEEIIHETKVVENQTFQTIIYARNEAIEIPGYEYKRANKDQIVIGVLEDTNVLTLYYQRVKSKIIVNYVDQITGEDVAPQTILTPYVGERYTCPPADLSDYRLMSYTPNYTGVAEAGDTVVYFYYRELTNVTVQFIDMNTGMKLEDDIVHEFLVGENFDIRRDEKQLTGYQLVEYPEVMAGTTNKNDITLIFKYAKRTSVIVRYMNRLTNQELIPNASIFGYVGKPYHAEKKAIDNYVYVSCDGNPDGLMTEIEVEVTFYYDEFSGGVLEQHIDETTGELLSNTLHAGVVGDQYQILPMSFAGYKLDRDELPSGTTGRMTEEPITVTYKYVKSATLKVNYVDEFTSGKIANTITYQGFTGDYYSIDEFRKNIAGYTLVRGPAGPFGTFDHDENEITFYYQRNTKVIVKYMEDDTDNVLAEEVIDGYVSQNYRTSIRNFEGYSFYHSSDNIEGVMTQNTIEVYYYYLKETSLTVKFVNKNSGDEIAESIVYRGLTGDYYNVSTDEKVIPGYTLTQTPEEISGRLKRDPITVIFYYKKNAKVTVKFVDKFSGEEVEERVVLQGLSGNNYNSEQKVIDGYTCVGNSGNTYGQYEDIDKEVIFYYAKNAKIKVMYLDMNSGNKLDQDEYSSYIGDTYTTTLKDFEGYMFINSDGILNGTTTEVNYTVTYYYALKSKVIAKYVDKRTGENIIEPIVIEGYESKPYKTELKTFEGYELAEKPIITEGRMEDEDITITYTYYHIAGNITERHYDSKTGKILYEEVHSGYVGDNYSFTKRDIPGYDVIEEKLPENSSGQMSTKAEKVEFYYIRKTTLRIQYLDEDGNKIIKDSVKAGHEGDLYTVEKTLISGYNLEKEPENSKGTLNVTYNADGTVTTETLVQYRYKKVSSDTSTADGKSETSVIPATLDYNQTVLVIAILAIITTAYGTVNGGKLAKVYADIRQYNKENKIDSNNVDIINGWENDRKKKQININLKETFNKIKESKVINKIKTIDLMKPIKQLKQRNKVETEEKQEYSSEEERINAIVEKEKQEFLDRIKYKKD